MIADVVLPIPVGKYFSYTVPVEIAPYVSLWSRVRVPFRQRDATGIVTAIREGDGTGLKAILEPLEFFPLVDPELAALADWASSFYLTPKGLVMKYALPPLRDIERYLVVETTGEGPSAAGSALLNKTIKRLGRLRLVQLFRQGSISLRDDITHRKFTAAHPMAGPSGDNQTERTVFIDSVGHRLERYITLIGKHIDDNGNILFLLPDHYAAGAYFTEKMKAIYGDRVLWFSSGVPVKQRMETYFRARQEGGYIILGNKNSVFLPVHNLSLIIAERYDDDEYRNEESFKFNAIRTAMERARSGGIPIVLGGAACCADIIWHARENGIAIQCNDWMAGSNFTNTIKTVGSRSPGELLDRLCTDIIETVHRGDNTAVYVPRKEYGSYLKCYVCRGPLACTKCGGHLDYDRDKDTLHCTACDAERPYMDACPNCGSNMIGFARIGASFVYDHLSRTAPGLNVTLITGDSLKEELPALRKKGPHRTQCLVGTRALSKLYGYHVDKLILADWEELRKMSGFRSEEKTHQIIANLIDALTPDEIVCYSRSRKSADLVPYLKTTAFYENELRKRKEADFPPFTRIFLVEARAKTQGAADRALAKVKTVLSDNDLDPFLFGTIPHNKPPFHSWKTVLKGPKDLLDSAFTDLYNIAGVEIEADSPNF